MSIFPNKSVSLLILKFWILIQMIVYHINCQFNQVSYKNITVYEQKYEWSPTKSKLFNQKSSNRWTSKITKEKRCCPDTLQGKINLCFLFFMPIWLCCQLMMLHHWDRGMWKIFWHRTLLPIKTICKNDVSNPQLLEKNF